ncbi:hypothetical protein I7I53_00900 [Histoplasma capsulatum var. duboisii H88]|uniref:Uncharacterized protein n=1 Tax=Ajellomyces capsulatus (strain H88) TaxID=544711 RepID=A0A8A1LGT8_AJEC8|nr:hypothetical protein I7I53_00900 [Histoplasma capsulatum var. duboisii H88]
MLSYLSIHRANLFISWIVIRPFHMYLLFTALDDALSEACLHDTHEYDNQNSCPISSSPTFVFHVLGTLSIHYRMKDYILSKAMRLLHPQSRSSRLRVFVFLFPFYS